jgi:hypothetical protein
LNLEESRRLPGFFCFWAARDLTGFLLYDSVKDPSCWIVRQPDNEYKCELISPLFSAEKFVENVRHVLKIVNSVPNTNVVGAISPTCPSQLGVRKKSDAAEKEILAKFKKQFSAVGDFPESDRQYYEKLTGEEIRSVYLNDLLRVAGESIDDIQEKYVSDKQNFFFRGQLFMTGDKNSSYAQFSPRSGRTGKAYAGLSLENSVDY